MKILFVMQHTGYIRNYEPVIIELAKRGHAVRLAFNGSKEQDSSQNEGILAGVLAASPNITCEEATAPRRSDGWADYATFIRTLRDCMRYLTPKYKNANELRARIFNRFQKQCGPIGRRLPVTNMLYAFRFITFGRGVGVLSRFIAGLELALPADKGIQAYLKAASPDVMLVTPLIDFASPQVDYVKAARTLGIRSALCVHSWDNLTNKGLIHAMPDSVILWNEAQKIEAIVMHGVSSDAVAITGAQCYDKWFERTPSRNRDTFFKECGLPEDTDQLITYLCSSPFIAPNEVEFVRRWIENVRKEPQLRDAAILIRPHPQNARQWAEADFSTLGGVTVWPRGGANPINTQAKNDFYDSMYYADAVVGINTSAMIEAGTLGKTVFTILDPAFEGTQEGTIHFHHLVKGGLLKVGKTLPEHTQQLRDTLENSEASVALVREFIESFVRPHGLDKPCTPFVADAVEAVARLPIAQPAPAPRWASKLQAPIGKMLRLKPQAS